MIHHSRRLIARLQPESACSTRVKALVSVFVAAYLVAFGFVGTHAASAAVAPSGASIVNVATATYVPAGFSQNETSSSNQVLANVLPVEALSLDSDQVLVRPPQGKATFNHLLANIGNVQSSYTFDLVSDGVGCNGTTATLSTLRLVRDTNNNGVVDPSDPVLWPGAPGALELAPGETAALLVSGTIPSVSEGTACLILSAITELQGRTASNKDIVSIGTAPAIQLTKTASYPGNIIAGSSRIDFTLNATNIGASDALVSSLFVNAAGAGTITVNGSPRELILVRDHIPSGTHYIAGTLGSATSGAVRLFRYSGDPPYAYRTIEDASAVEVAIGLPSPLTPNSSMAMSFAVKVNPEQSGTILNTAYVHYSDGDAAAVSPSNTVVLSGSEAAIGLAKAASPPVLNRDSSGTPDGTITTTFSVRIRNEGTTWLYDVQVEDLLEGTAASQFGGYTASEVPGTGQYAIVPGSLRLGTPPSNGVIASVNNGYTGQSGSADLLAPGAVLPAGAETTVLFDVRINTVGRSTLLTNSATGKAALVAGGIAQVSDVSTNGSDPDPDGDGNSANNSVPTPVSLVAPALTLSKTASLPRRIAQGVYEIDYGFKVTNIGTSGAPFVRVIDNFECTFDMDKATGGIAEWQLVGPVRAQNGLLAPSSSFTGRAACNRSSIDSDDPFHLPGEIGLSLTDGTRALGPGQSEVLLLTVRVTEKVTTAGTPVTVTNKAWAAAFNANMVNLMPSATVSATSSTVQSLLIDPSGTVYDSVSRRPVAGATVTYSRISCSSGPLMPITPEEIHEGSSGRYTFNGDGSLSMTTGPDGAYQFYLRSPPVTNVCTYAIKVTPPLASAYVVPSEIIQVAQGSFDRCGAVVPNAGPPQGSDPTTYYGSVSAGLKSDGSACEVVHNHIPLDPGDMRGLILEKGGSRSQVEIGDFIDYALVLTNKTGMPVDGVVFSDTLPAGFAYVPNSSRLTDISERQGVLKPDPEGGKGPVLTWTFPELSLADAEKVTLRYRVRVGVGSPRSGEAINRATVTSGPLKSNLASYTVRLSGGVFSDEAFLFGKVYMACSPSSRDRRQAALPDFVGRQAGDAPGVPGVRLFLEDGTSVFTDGEGKWSLYGLKPITHVIRIDQSTLPTGTSPVLLDNRNALDPQSRFVDLKNGEMHKADFALSGCANPEAMAAVAARRKPTAQRSNPDGEIDSETRLDPTGAPVRVGDRRSLPASGGATLATAGVSQTAVAAPLISLPASSGAPDSFVSGVGNGRGGQGTLAQALAGSLKLPQGHTGSRINGTYAKLQGADGTTLPPSASSEQLPARHVSNNPDHGAADSLPAPVPASADLETLLPTLDPGLGFVGLREADTLSSAVTNIRVKGPAGVTLALLVNGEIQALNRVGKKATLPSKGIAAWDYIGVQLKAGANVLRLEAHDDFGNVRENAVEIRVLAPGNLADLVLDLPKRAYADGRTPIPVTLRLTDFSGVPVTARTQITLEADEGRWVEEDLNPSEPGSQYFVNGGEAVFHLLAPATPGNLRIRALAGALQRDSTLLMVPEMRPMIGVGIIEGVIDLTNRGKLAVGQDPASKAFEEDLSRIGGRDDEVRPAGRAAFFFKGTILGKYLLTAAADTAKSDSDRLFRDIRPDEFYPIYGDASSRGFDAQSTQKVYVRIDQDRSFVLYGDFISASSPEVRLLTQSNRSLTGFKSVVQTDSLRATTYAAQTSQRQQIEEFQGNGISGPYYLGGTGDFIENSEKIELLVRNRNQPDIVLATTVLERFVDYTIEPLTRRILFTRPIASVDSNLNPQSIRVTYEVESGGEQYLVAGADVQVKVADGLQLGAIATIDDTPDNRRKLGGATALARIGEHTTLTGEAVLTETDANGTGAAGRMELRYQDKKLGVGIKLAHADARFDNPASSMSAGRTEASARAEYRVSPTVAFRFEGLLSDDTVTHDSVKGVTVSLQKQLSPDLTAEVGVRYGSATSATASLFDYGQTSIYSATGGGSTGSVGSASSAENLATVRARLTAKIPGLPNTQLFAEGEQDLADGDRHSLGIGGTYGLSDKTRLYGRYMLDSSLGGEYTLSSTSGRNIGVVGIESTVLGTGRAYNEYRIADSLDGRSGQNAIGLRNTFPISKRLRLTGGLEYTRATGQASTDESAATLGQGNAIAFTSGVEYLAPALKASGILEARLGDDAHSWLGSGGVAYKISDDWSLLARTVYSSSTGRGANLGNDRILSREQIGLAWRPADSNVWNALARYEHKSEVIRGSSGEIPVGTLSGSSFSSDALLPGTYITDIFSGHLNINPQPGFQIMGRLAAKFSMTDDGLLRSRSDAQLGQIRVIRDITDRWDVGVQGALMHGDGGAWKKSLGLEAGYLVSRNLWLSGGYNVIGLYDRDLSAGDYTSQGVFFRLRFKFGESDLGFRPVEPPLAPGAAAGGGSATVADSAPTVPEAFKVAPDVEGTTTLTAPDIPSGQGKTSTAGKPAPTLPVLASQTLPPAKMIDASSFFTRGSTTLRSDRVGALDALVESFISESMPKLVLCAKRGGGARSAGRFQVLRSYLLGRGIEAESIIGPGLGCQADPARAVFAL